VVHLVHVHAVVMVLQPLSGDALLLLLLVGVVRQRRAAAAEPERELERVAQDAPKAAPERDVDDEVGGRVDDEQQLADDVQSHEVMREHETVLEVTLRERHLQRHSVT